MKSSYVSYCLARHRIHLTPSRSASTRIPSSRSELATLLLSSSLARTPRSPRPGSLFAISPAQVLLTLNVDPRPSHLLSEQQYLRAPGRAHQGARRVLLPAIHGGHCTAPRERRICTCFTLCVCVLLLLDSARSSRWIPRDASSSGPRIAVRATL